MKFRKPPLLLCLLLTALALGSLDSTLAASQDQQPADQAEAQAPPYTLAEYMTAFTELSERLMIEADQQTKIQLLDDFTAKYPASEYPARSSSQFSALRAGVYREYYLAYFALRKYPQALGYLDKLIALGNLAPLAGLQDLIVRAQIFILDCGDDAFATPEAYAQTKDSATKGLKALNEPQARPSGLSNDEFAERKQKIEKLFTSELAIADAGLKGAKPPKFINGIFVTSDDACKAAPDAGFAVEGVSFDQMIDDIKAQERQGPRVR